MLRVAGGSTGRLRIELLPHSIAGRDHSSDTSLVLELLKRLRRQQLTETTIPAGSCTAGVAPGVDMSQVPLSVRVKWSSRTGAKVPLGACGKFPRIVCCTSLIFVSDPTDAEHSVIVRNCALVWHQQRTRRCGASRVELAKHP